VENLIDISFPVVIHSIPEKILPVLVQAKTTKKPTELLRYCATFFQHVFPGKLNKCPRVFLSLSKFTDTDPQKRKLKGEDKEKDCGALNAQDSKKLINEKLLVIDPVYNFHPFVILEGDELKDSFSGLAAAKVQNEDMFKLEPGELSKATLSDIWEYLAPHCRGLLDSGDKTRKRETLGTLKKHPLIYRASTGRAEISYEIGYTIPTTGCTTVLTTGPNTGKRCGRENCRYHSSSRKSPAKRRKKS